MTQNKLKPLKMLPISLYNKTEQNYLAGCIANLF